MELSSDAETDRASARDMWWVNAGTKEGTAGCRGQRMGKRVMIRMRVRAGAGVRMKARVRARQVLPRHRLVKSRII